MNNIASVKDRLKNKADSSGKTMMELLTAYGLERTVYRLSVSRFANNFTLKGAIFLYALFGGEYARATTDIDLEARLIGNDPEGMRAVFEEIFSIEADDPLRFDLGTLEVKRITEFKEYPGINVSVMAFLDRTRIPVSIDIGFDDVIYPGRVRMDFPVVLSEVPPKIYAYSLSSCIAEKFEAIVSLAYDNSRLKDFYDLYVIACSRDIDGAELLGAMKETFAHRNVRTDVIAAFEPDFTEDPIRRTRWTSFVKKKRAMLPVTFEETIGMIRTFIGPVLNAMKNGEEFDKVWRHENREWEE